MKTLLKKVLGIKGIEAWAIIGPDDFLLVQNRPDMEYSIYVDSKGNCQDRDKLKIVPCTITY